MGTALWRALSTLLLLSCLVSFRWAMGRFFVQPNGLTPGMRSVKLVGTFFALVHLAMLAVGPLRLSVVTMGLAIALYLLSLSLFWWALDSNRTQPLSAVFSPDLPVHLVDQGPYHYIRHPFYASYLTAWMAGVFATGQDWLLLSVLVMAALYYWAAESEERKFEASSLAGDYQAYRARTGRFVPNLSSFIKQV